jgi:outer membrane protein
MTKRQRVAAVLSLTCPAYIGSAGWAQQLSIAPAAPSMPAIVRPYFAPEAPPVRLANSRRLSELVRAGNLYLTVQDAIALALENNIDMEVARYNPLIAAWNVTRAEAGGALPGVPSNASQAGAVANGQGVTGSQAAIGASIPGTGSNRGATTNATIQQIGPVTQTLDPVIQEASTLSHTSNPQPDATQSETPNLVTDTRAASLSYQQGLLTGGSVTLTYTDNYLNENSPTDVLNPSSAPSVAISFQQNFLQGFGVAVNARTITVQKMNVGISALTFQTQVVNVVTQVLNDYYSLAGAIAEAKAKREAAEVAHTFLTNVQEQAKLGALSPSEAIDAEAQLVSSRLALVNSEATLTQQELQLKSMISRTGTGDPVLTTARIVPLDPIAIPEKDDLPPLAEMVKQALDKRSDLAAERQTEAATEVSALGTRNGVLPSGGVFASASQAGLAGAGHTVLVDGVPQAPDPYFVGGIGTALGQVFRRDYPTESAALFYSGQFRNRQALADYAIDQLQLRQTQLTTRKDLNQVEVDVQNYAVALRQARARYDAAVRNRVLQEDLFTSEQKKFKLGASVPFNVIQLQRDLLGAQSTEIAAQVSYSSARVALDRTLGVILDVNHVSLAEARAGTVARKSSIPEQLPGQP